MSRTDTLPSVQPAVVEALTAVCSDLGTGVTDRMASAHDASIYVLTPQVVATHAMCRGVAADRIRTLTEGTP